MRPVVFATVLLSGCALLPQHRPPPSTAERVAELLGNIDRNSDPLHLHYTPAVHELVEIGEPALLPTLELMLLDGEDHFPTRLHAQSVLWYWTLKQHGFVSGQGWQTPDGAQSAERFWNELGDLDYRAPLAKRAASVELWRQWLANRSKVKSKES